MFVCQVGDKIQKGQVVCIIEAMKLMNEIEVSVHINHHSICNFKCFQDDLSKLEYS